MKRKFFLTIFFVLLTTVGTVTALHLYFLKIERLRLIDQQIETSASLVISSDLTSIPLDDIEDLEDFFHELLGSQKTNKIILIRDLNGKVLYSSKNAEWLPDDPPQDVRWQTIREEGHTIRILSVEIPQLKKLLQIGMVLDSELGLWRRIDLKYILFSVGTAILILIVSIFLTSTLLNPMRNLSAYLNHLSIEIEKGKMGEAHTSSVALRMIQDKDEFGDLTREVLKLRDKISIHYSLFQTWTAQMAHSLRTPLTIIRNQLDRMKLAGQNVGEAQEEIGKLDSTISSFLSWASLEGGPGHAKQMDAIQVGETLQGLVDQFERIYPGRIQFVQKGNLRLFADREQFEQAFSNLVSNALKYSPENSKVSLSIDEQLIKIQDNGPGIPSSVLERLGQPFNYGEKNSTHGSGLGLAWAYSICKKYGWKLTFDSSPNGTVVTLST